jgi:nucleoside-diphosphate-sugar epimerase
VPAIRAKRHLEHRLASRSAESWILRFPPFMESWFALVGSSLPLRGEQHATIGRPSPFLRRFRAVTGSLVEDRGLMLVPGPPTHRHAFISVHDAARACVAAAVQDGPPPAAPLEVGGPEILSWRDVAALFAEVLHRRVRVVATPPPVYAAVSRVLEPVAPVPSRTMALNFSLGRSESPYAVPGGGLVDPATMLTAEEFLRRKAALSPDLIPVP